MKYEKKLLKEINKAYKKKEIPVGCVIEYQNRIISKAHNIKQKSHDVTGHAEIIAIKKAAKKLKDWRLEDCILYVTLEPCDMCKEVIRQSRIKKVYYITNSKFNNEKNKTIIYEKSPVSLKTEEIVTNRLLSFFSSKR